MPSTAFLSDLVTTIADRGRALLRLERAPVEPARQASALADLCERLLSGRGEATGAALAQEVLERFARLDAPARATFFHMLAAQFGPDRERLAQAVARYTAAPAGGPASEQAAADLHFASEPRRQELFRRLNRAPNGTAALVAMRADLLSAIRDEPGLKGVDRDFGHLFSSWFNRGFLQMRRIDWSTPASLLEKIIRYEAVHEIRDWDELRLRIDAQDRRCYAFFHPALPDEPLIFVEVALTADIPAAIQPLLAHDRTPLPPREARVAVFYSISNCQQGLAGVSFGNFLIKQVVEELRREFRKTLETFVTLSPVPGFMRWLRSEATPALPPDEQATLAALDDPAWAQNAQQAAALRPLIERLAATYFLEARDNAGRARDPVARFHLGNGARLERINWLGDISRKGLNESAGVMVNYLYESDEIEDNHEAYANNNEIVASSAVRRMTRSSGRIDKNKNSTAKMPPVIV